MTQPIDPDKPPTPVGRFEELSFQTVEEFTAHIMSMRDDVQEINNKLAYDDALIEELTKKLNAVKAHRRPNEEAKFDLHKKIKAEEAEMESLKRQMALEAEERRLWEAMNSRRQKLDELTATAVWRDYALPHQIEGAHTLSAAHRAICADGMGTGKTLQAVMTLDFWTANLDGGVRVLIVCPNEVVRNFQLEFNKWAPQRRIINFSGKSAKVTIGAIEMFNLNLKNCVYLFNYEKLARFPEIVDKLIESRFDTVIVDEAHKMKEVNKATYRAISRIVLTHNQCPICEKPVEPIDMRQDMTIDNHHNRMGKCDEHGIVEGCERSVKNYMSMTGTPILNRPDEIFASLSLAAPHIFKDIDDFRDDFCVRGWDNKWKWLPGGESRLVNKIKGMYLRRTREDAGIILPPQTVTIHELECDPETYPLQSKLLTMLAEHAQMEIDEGKAVTFFHMLPLITRQRQAAVWPGGIWIDNVDKVTGEKYRDNIGLRYLESVKLDKAVELADEFVTENGERIVLFSQFREAVDETVSRLMAKGIRAVAFHGGTPMWKRDEIVRNFDRKQGEKPKWDAVVAHYKLGGEGLNLTAATQAIILDEQWSPGMAQQAYDRIRRMGQTEETGIHILRLMNSIDTWMAELIEAKKKIVDGFEVEITFQQLADMFKKPQDGRGKEAA